MKETTLSLPDIILVAGTRVALGIGVGLLLARRLSESARKGAGAALLAVGALSTIPLALNVIAGRKQAHSSYPAHNSAKGRGPDLRARSRARCTSCPGPRGSPTARSTAGAHRSPWELLSFPRGRKPAAAPGPVGWRWERAPLLSGA